MDIIFLRCSQRVGYIYVFVRGGGVSGEVGITTGGFRCDGDNKVCDFFKNNKVNINMWMRDKYFSYLLSLI